MNVKGLLQGAVGVGCCTAGMAVAQTPPAPSAEVAALTELYARIELQKKILEAERAMLQTNMGQGVTLPTGKIEALSAAIMPSVIHMVSYDALHALAGEICADIAGYQAGAELPRTPATVLVTTANLRDMREQRLAIAGYMRGIEARVVESIQALAPPPPPSGGGGARPAPRAALAGAVGGAASILLGIDAIGAVGKAIAGLAGFFKTDRQIGGKDAVVTDEVLLLAMRTCNPKLLRIVDPAAVEVLDADVADDSPYMIEATRLARDTSVLRDLLERTLGRLDLSKRGLVPLKETLEKAKTDDEKAKARAAVATRELEIAELENLVKAPVIALNLADTAALAFITVDAAKGVSPMINYVRMGKIIDKLKAHSTTPVLTVKMQHSSGYSQVSKAWWRNDKLDFAGGLAISYTLSSVAGEYQRSNMFYVQTPWQRLNEGRGTFSGQPARNWRTMTQGDAR